MGISDTDFWKLCCTKGRCPWTQLGRRFISLPVPLALRLIDYWKEVWLAVRKARTIEECEWSR